MDEAEVRACYAPPREFCDPNLIEDPNEPLTRKEAAELTKVFLMMLVGFGLPVGGIAALGKCIEYVEFGGFEGLELPEPREEIPKAAPKTPSFKSRPPVQAEKLPLPRAFHKLLAPKEAFRKAPIKKLLRVQHF